ncbi:MAG: transcription termination factor Rho [Luteolibacter sp.]
MSKNTSDELFDLPPAEKPAKPARKVAAKKAAKKAAAKKTPAKKAAKKAAAKKAAVKKVAKAKEASPVPVEKAPAPVEKAPVPRTEKPVETPKPRQTAPPREEQNDKPQPRIGRVPGGGPVNQQSEPRAHDQNGDQQPISRSKKRREKRKRRRDGQGDQGGYDNRRDRNDNRNDNRRDRNDNRRDRNDRQQEDRSPTVLSGDILEVDGIIEMTPKGFGFLRLANGNFEQAKDDIFISPELIRNHSLRHGQWLHGKHQGSNRGQQLIEIETVNGMPPADAAKLPHFDELKAINPDKRIAFETTPERYTTRVIDIVSPVGRGQRGLIVSPPRSGKTTLLLHMAEAIREKYDEQIHLMVLLVDERPEEVTEFRRALPGAEIYASSNDEATRNHCRIAELAIERAKRLVEAGQDVFLLMDSITRLARAYNGNMGGGKGGRGRATGSGGITIGALEVPRRLFAAARNTREAGSLTILATALIQTNSRADEAIFMEFKGTGNMELVLDRKIAESYIYPAVDIFRSGTRREELLLAEHTLHKIHLIRRGLSGHRPYEAMERLLYFIKKFPNNPQMLLEIKG